MFTRLFPIRNLESGLAILHMGKVLQPSQIEYQGHYLFATYKPAKQEDLDR